ncbi:MAG: flagellar assembly peptidoglycan hydrolase FlgJ [Xanthomonadaceae bacterium]|nr:flagellar assembly peptidoglycan hydrolase FlgJ [Xanthomonadaceae bacterium]MDP2184553.1 flagellar assembly peptidoglycan hydrolase FlgJ [Xanthomonadales bacterium]MDZ4116364.1 flagellar assembly peptidoglycan hydrolase FlgJ [Xanthomonadaceae bacterium]MDZ4378897.1 flagellar assembly peptidoglycan hydrolase FlgJ [Xanthomonadaceae bacterium]
MDGSTASSIYTDFSGLASLRAQARDDSQGALREVAQQFEAIFTQMLLKSMRAASLGDGIFDSNESKTYMDMFDQQLSVSMAATGKGMGIADMLVRQLRDAVPASATATDAIPLQRDNAGLPLAGAGNSALPNQAELSVRRLLRGAAASVETARASVAGAAEILGGNPAAFVLRMAPHAKAAADALGVSLRSVLAHAALETGWGKHVPAAADGQSSFNLFGIKAGGSWDGARISRPTIEFEQGVAVRRAEAFRAYDSPAEGFADYARLLAGSSRYAAALGRGDDVGGFAQALQQGGYATDPAYAVKLSAVAQSPQMQAALAQLETGSASAVATSKTLDHNAASASAALWPAASTFWQQP